MKRQKRDLSRSKIGIHTADVNNTKKVNTTFRTINTGLMNSRKTIAYSTATMKYR